MESVLKIFVPFNLKNISTSTSLPPLVLSICNEYPISYIPAC